MIEVSLRQSFIIFFLSFFVIFSDDTNAKNSKKILSKESEKKVSKISPSPKENKKAFSIVIKGNERIDLDTLKSYIDQNGLKSGNKLAINSSLKSLYESDLFLDVKIYEENSQMIVEVKENPIISDVKFEGNKKIEEEALLSEIRLKKRSIYTKSKLQADIKRINDIYIKSGRFLTKIDPRIVEKDQNRIDLVFKISEGPKAKISEINFVGNKVFNDQDLMDEITTAKTKWWKFLSSADSYDSDRIQFDREKLRRFYNSKGYADFTVISAIAQITQAKDKFFITFLLDEGIKYNFGEINIANKVKKFDEAILLDEIQTKKNKVYNGDLVDKTVDKMVEIMSERGYAFAHIEPVLKRDREKQIIDIDYVINETPRVYINQIHIIGNTRTYDDVIRRELRVREGDAYNINKINRSRQRINNLGFFDKVEVNSKRIGDTDKVDLEIEVKEKKTGELNFGIGYSTVDKATASIGIKERNLLGTGQEMGFNIQRSKYRLSSEINYTKPYFTNREIAVGADLFNYQLDKRNTLVYAQNSKGFTLRGDYSITEYLKHQVRYSFNDQNISDIDPTASLTIQNLQGRYINSGVGHSFVYDKRDNRFDPRDGYYFNISEDYAGIGGNMNYLKHEGSAAYYIPIITNDFVLKFSGRFGYIDGIGQDIRSNNNYFLGGNNFRGFEYAGLGPRTVVNGTAVGGNAVGGKMYYVSTTELRFPLGLPKELGINGALFNDMGTLKGVDQVNKNGTAVVDTGSMRSTYGISIVWSSPLGPIRLDFSKIAKMEQFDRKETFRFSFGSTF